MSVEEIRSRLNMLDGNMKAMKNDVARIHH